MFTVYLIKVFGVETLAVALALIKCCGVAINIAGLPNVRETILQNRIQSKRDYKAIMFKWIHNKGNTITLTERNHLI